jgi:hypothetical protein
MDKSLNYCYAARNRQSQKIHSVPFIVSKSCFILLALHWLQQYLTGEETEASKSQAFFYSDQ